MSIWQITVFIGIAGCTIGCLLGIFRAIEKLAKSLFSIGAELTKINAKLESVEAVNSDDPKKPMDHYESDLEAIETAISSFEKLKRIDLTTPQGNKW
jgi:hypothetical protein